MADAVQKAQEVYYLENDSYTTDFTKLDISFDGELNSSRDRIYSAEGGNVLLRSYCVITYHNLLPGIAITFHYLHRNDGWKGRWCYAVRTNDQANKFCQNVTGSTTKESVNDYAGNPAYCYRFQND